MRLREGNPMTRALMTTLIFEAVVFLLAVPGMVQIENVAPTLALGAGGGAALLALVAGGTLKRPFGWPLAWLAQVAAVAMGLLTPWMFAVGGGFAALFVVEFVLGRRIEADGGARR